MTSAAHPRMPLSQRERRVVPFLNLMRKQGWQLSRISGSHHVHVREGRRSIPVVVHNRCVRRDVARQVLRQAGIVESDRLFAEVETDWVQIESSPPGSPSSSDGGTASRQRDEAAHDLSDSVQQEQAKFDPPSRLPGPVVLATEEDLDAVQELKRKERREQTRQADAFAAEFLDISRKLADSESSTEEIKSALAKLEQLQRQVAAGPAFVCYLPREFLLADPEICSDEEQHHSARTDAPELQTHQLEQLVLDIVFLRSTSLLELALEQPFGSPEQMQNIRGAFQIVKDTKRTTHWRSTHKHKFDAFHTGLVQHLFSRFLDDVHRCTKHSAKGKTAVSLGYTTEAEQIQMGKPSVEVDPKTYERSLRSLRKALSLFLDLFDENLVAVETVLFHRFCPSGTPQDRANVFAQRFSIASHRSLNYMLVKDGVAATADRSAVRYMVRLGKFLEAHKIFELLTVVDNAARFPSVEEHDRKLQITAVRSDRERAGRIRDGDVGRRAGTTSDTVLSSSLDDVWNPYLNMSARQIGAKLGDCFRPPVGLADEVLDLREMLAGSHSTWALAHAYQQALRDSAQDLQSEDGTPSSHSQRQQDASFSPRAGRGERSPRATPAKVFEHLANHDVPLILGIDWVDFVDERIPSDFAEVRPEHLGLIMEKRVFGGLEDGQIPPVYDAAGAGGERTDLYDEKKVCEALERGRHRYLTYKYSPVSQERIVVDCAEFHEKLEKLNTIWVDELGMWDGAGYDKSEDCDSSDSELTQMKTSLQFRRGERQLFGSTRKKTWPAVQEFLQTTIQTLHSFPYPVFWRGRSDFALPWLLESVLQPFENGNCHFFQRSVDLLLCCLHELDRFNNAELEQNYILVHDLCKFVFSLYRAADKLDTENLLHVRNSSFVQFRFFQMQTLMRLALHMCQRFDYRVTGRAMFMPFQAFFELMVAKLEEEFRCEECIWCPPEDGSSSTGRGLLPAGAGRRERQKKTTVALYLAEQFEPIEEKGRSGRSGAAGEGSDSDDDVAFAPHPGTRVIIRNLKAGAQYNGLPAVVLGRATKSGDGGSSGSGDGGDIRYCVRLDLPDQRKELSLKSANMRPAASGADAATVCSRSQRTESEDLREEIREQRRFYSNVWHCSSTLLGELFEDITDYLPQDLRDELWSLRKLFTLLEDGPAGLAEFQTSNRLNKDFAFNPMRHYPVKIAWRVLKCDPEDRFTAKALKRLGKKQRELVKSLESSDAACNRGISKDLQKMRDLATNLHTNVLARIVRSYPPRTHLVWSKSQEHKDMLRALDSGMKPEDVSATQYEQIIKTKNIDDVAQERAWNEPIFRETAEKYLGFFTPDFAVEVMQDVLGLRDAFASFARRVKPVFGFDYFVLGDERRRVSLTDRMGSKLFDTCCEQRFALEKLCEALGVQCWPLPP